MASDPAPGGTADPVRSSWAGGLRRRLRRSRRPEDGTCGHDATSIAGAVGDGRRSPGPSPLEHELADLVAVGRRRARRSRSMLAVVQHGDAVRQLEQLVEVLGDQDARPHRAPVARAAAPGCVGSWRRRAPGSGRPPPRNSLSAPNARARTTRWMLPPDSVRPSGRRGGHLQPGRLVELVGAGAGPCSSRCPSPRRNRRRSPSTMCSATSSPGTTDFGDRVLGDADGTRARSPARPPGAPSVVPAMRTCARVVIGRRPSATS